MNIQILETDIDTAASVSILIPELIDPHTAEEYHRRMDGKTFSITSVEPGESIDEYRIMLRKSL